MFCGCTALFVSNLVGNPKDRFPATRLILSHLFFIDTETTVKLPLPEENLQSCGSEIMSTENNNGPVISYGCQDDINRHEKSRSDPQASAIPPRLLIGQFLSFSSSSFYHKVHNHNIFSIFCQILCQSS